MRANQASGRTVCGWTRASGGLCGSIPSLSARKQSGLSAPDSLAIDIYIWLAYRLHSLDRSTPITWLALHAQFGAGMKALRHFKPVFLEAFRLAMAVYPEAEVDVDEDRTGIVMHPSPPAVPKQTSRRLLG